MLRNGIRKSIIGFIRSPQVVAFGLSLFLFIAVIFHSKPFEIVPSEGDLIIQISPEGYPQVDDKWTITVWRVEANNRREPAEGAIVELILSQEDQSIFQLTANENGNVEFTYMSEYDYHVIFHASLEGYKDAYARPEGSYTTEGKVDWFLNTFTISSFGVVLGVFAIPIPVLIVIEKRIKKKKELINPNKFICGILTFAFLPIFFLGSHFAGRVLEMQTKWGYLVSSELATLQTLHGLVFALLFAYAVLWGITFIRLYVASRKRDQAEEGPE